MFFFIEAFARLKRILRRKGLTKWQNYNDPAEVVAAVGRELQRSGSLIGYRQMHQTLRTDYGLVADRETVRTILKTLDHDRAERLSKRFSNITAKDQTTFGTSTGTTN